MKSKLMLFAMMSLFAFACTKDKVAPTLNIASPSENAQSTGVVIIKGTVLDEHLHSLSLKITDDQTGALLYSKELAIDGLTSYGYEEQYTPTISLVSHNVTLTVEVSDKNDSKTSKQVKFTLVP